jgi:hypothetical protein
MTDIVEYNKRNIDRFNEELATISDILLRIRTETIIFDDNIGTLQELLDMYGDSYTEISVNLYNSYLSTFYNNVSRISGAIGKNRDGVTKKIFKTWSENDKFTPLRLSYKDNNGNWFKCKEIVSIPNIKIASDFDLCVSASYPINIGCNTTTLETLVFGETVTTNLVLNNDDLTQAILLLLTLDFPATKSADVPFSAADFGFLVTDGTGGVFSL